MPGPFRADDANMAMPPGLLAAGVTENASLVPPLVPQSLPHASITEEVNSETVRDRLKDQYQTIVRSLVERRLRGEPVLVATHRDELRVGECTAILAVNPSAGQPGGILHAWPKDTTELAEIRRAAFADIFCEQLVGVGKNELMRLAQVSQHPVLIAFTNCALNAPLDLDFKDQVAVIRAWFSSNPYDVAVFNDSPVNLVEAAVLLDVYARASDRQALRLSMNFAPILNCSGFDTWIPKGSIEYAQSFRSLMSEHLDRQPPTLLTALMQLEGGFAVQQSKKLGELDPRKFTTCVEQRHRVVIRKSCSDTPSVASRIKLNRDFLKVFDAFCDEPASGTPLDNLVTQFFAFYRTHCRLSKLTNLPLSGALTLTPSHTEILGSWAQRSYRSELARWGTLVREHHQKKRMGMCPHFHVSTVHGEDYEYSGWYQGEKFQLRDPGKTSLLDVALGSFQQGRMDLRVGISSIFLLHFEALVKESEYRARL